MIYLRKLNESLIAYSGPAMGTTWFNANGWIAYSGNLPLNRLDIVDGIVVELPEPPQTHDWQDKELFIDALYALMPPATISDVLRDAEATKSAVAGVALLTTDAAPGNSIDLMDARVAQWLAIGGLTVAQVREKMEELANG